MNTWRERLAVAPLGIMFARYFISMTAAFVAATMYAVAAAVVVWATIVRGPARLTLLAEALRDRSGAQDAGPSQPRPPVRDVG